MLVWLAGGGGVALGGVEGTHHDMRLYTLEEEQSVCAYCHVPHRAASDENLLAREGDFFGELGRVGSFCYTCHDGTVVPTALIESADGELGIDALVGSHGLEIGALEFMTEGLEAPVNVSQSGLVTVDPETGMIPNRMECTGCHDPHSSEHPPFLKRPLFDLCQQCHSGAAGGGEGRFGSVEDTGTANGPHPIGMPYKVSGMDRTRPELKTPEIVLQSAIDPRYNVPVLDEAGLQSAQAHWEMGGHLSTSLTSGQGSGLIGCPTCHSAHNSRKKLLLVTELLDPSGDRGFCHGCHTADRPENPGGTLYYHPVLAESAPPYRSSGKTAFPILVNIPSTYPVTAQGELRCFTCHRMHQGEEGEKALRRSVQGESSLCDSCHTGYESTAAAKTVTNGLLDYDNDEADVHHIVARFDFTRMSPYRYENPTWWDGNDGSPGDLKDGLTCQDCHTELAKSAHNW